MDFKFEVEYILSLASRTQKDINRDIGLNRRGGEGSNMERQRSLIIFNAPVDRLYRQMDYFKVNVLPNLNNPEIPVEYGSMLNAYFKLVTDVFHALLGSGEALSKNLIENIFSMLQMVIDISDRVVSNGLVPDGTISSLTFDIISNRVMFDSELQLSVIDEVKVGYIKRIDSEMSSVHKDLNLKLKDISKEYSDGRSKIIETYNDYEVKVNSLLSKADEAITKYDSDFEEKKVLITKKEMFIDGKLLNAEKKLEVIDGLLERTSQAGMASAFKARHLALKWPMCFWVVLFFVCLCLLTLIGKEFVLSAFSSEIKSMAEVVSKLVATFPLIWGAWFSAKQYGHISQLREDYAYKVAVAMTYHGYKDEAKNVEGDMSGKLMDSIITQFSDNPVRLYQNNSSASMVEALIKNDKLSDMMNAASKPK